MTSAGPKISKKLKSKLKLIVRNILGNDDVEHVFIMDEHGDILAKAGADKDIESHHDFTLNYAGELDNYEENFIKQLDGKETFVLFEKNDRYNLYISIVAGKIILGIVFSDMAKLDNIKNTANDAGGKIEILFRDSFGKAKIH